MTIINNLDIVPPGLPVPIDDGACNHLRGHTLPSIPLPATNGHMIDLAHLSGTNVVYIYPRTGQPGVPPLVDHWNDIPGARGCTPQSRGFRELAPQFDALGVRIFGLSTQPTDYQQEAVARLGLPFALLSDAELRLTRSLRLPTFDVAGQTLLKRMAWVIEQGVIAHVFYPVYPPDENAHEVLTWLQVNRR